MNKSILMGRLTKDPEVRYTQSSEPMAVAHYILAINRKFKRENEPEADFIPCVVFGKQAEFAEKHLRKGIQIIIIGRIQVRKWQNSQDVTQWITEIVVEEQNFTEKKENDNSYNGDAQYTDDTIQQNTPQNNQTQPPSNTPNSFDPFQNSAQSETNKQFDPFKSNDMNFNVA